MNPEILNIEVQNFITKHLDADISKLIFKGSPFENVSIQEIVEQIEAKRRCKTKLPTWFSTKNVYYPNKLNIEQTSSEITAHYKSKLISGNSLIDLTGGFGVDSYFFAKQFKEVTHCELNTELSEIVSHNFEQFSTKNIVTRSADGIKYLEDFNETFDWVYIDPSRRSNTKAKVFLLKDCLPNVPENLDALFKHSKNILIKTSPILDISSAINERMCVKEVHVVAVENEVKELLFMLNSNYKDDIKIKAVNIQKNKIDSFNVNLNAREKASFSEPNTYLYEPNAAILKAGLFNEVSHKLKVFKIHKNSHLYTSNKIIKFPGRRFEILHQVRYNKKEILKLLPNNKANITTRNFPETVAQIRNKTNIKEGGDLYLFFTTDINNKLIVLVCKKV